MASGKKPLDNFIAERLIKKMYKQVLQKVILPISELVTGISLSKELRKLRVITSKTEEELKEIQLQKLNKLLQFSVKNATYYKELGITLDEKNPIQSLKKFPILTKPLLKENSDKLLTEDKETLIKYNSSGSTGKQTTVYWNKSEQTIHRATQLLWWEWAGYSIGDNLVQTGMSSPRPFLKRCKDIFFRTKYILAFAHEEQELETLFKNLDKDKKYILAGYASSLYVLASFAKKKNIQIPFRAVISWGDKLFDHYRTTIKEVFGSKTYETYASTEGFMIAAQKDLDYMYIMSSNVYLEIVDDNGNEVEDGELGHVIVTNLNGTAMPLIRYKLGDLAIKLPKDKYPTHRDMKFPILQKVVGRDTDLVKTPTGKYMVVHSFTGIFEHILEIDQFCVIQNELTGVVIEYIPKETSVDESILEKAKQQILEHLHESFEITFKQVSEIKSTPSGKPQVIISNLKK